MKKGIGILSMQCSLELPRIIRAHQGEVVALFSAEHGFFGKAAAGEKISDAIHPDYKLPIRSLYGEHRRPTKEMMADISAMIIDLCDLGVRCYTYLSTLKLMLEVCAEEHIPVTVIDHPIPLGSIVDGPRREEAYSSFVAPLDVPLLYAMTPGEAAEYIRKAEKLELELNVEKLGNWRRSQGPYMNFVPPSPAIRSWDSAAFYPMLVFSEAYPALDIDRAGSLAFRYLAAPFIDKTILIERAAAPLNGYGIEIMPHREGVLFSISDISRFRPVSAGVKLLEILFELYSERLAESGREEWMAKLYGSKNVLAAIKARRVDELIASWEKGNAQYLQEKVEFYS